MGRVKDKGIKGSFIALPWSVVDSSNFAELSPAAVKLLLDMARQFKGFNNGDLVACFSYMKKRGWKSTATLARALKELKGKGFICETRKGRQNVCSLYGVTWQKLNPSKEQQIKPADFPYRSYAKEHKTKIFPHFKN